MSGMHEMTGNPEGFTSDPEQPVDSTSSKNQTLHSKPDGNRSRSCFACASPLVGLESRRHFVIAESHASKCPTQKPS
jgi:hypothetical protein